MKISQREARRLRKRVAELEQASDDQRRSWVNSYPGGEHVGRVSWTDDALVPHSIHTARKLGHAVVAVASDAKRIDFYALPLPK